MTATIYRLPARRVLEVHVEAGADCEVYDLNAWRDVRGTLAELAEVGEFERALSSGWVEDTGLAHDLPRWRRQREDKVREIGPVLVRAQVTR